jgi:hypothetical protein
MLRRAAAQGCRPPSVPVPSGRRGLKLRKALDELFYRDTLKRRILEVGVATMAETIPREIGDNDDEYVDRVIAFIGDRIGGFSISHVSGRFRTGAILSREKSAEQIARDIPYLIDETTAVVRFIIPCLSSRTAHGVDFNLDEPAQAREADVKLEVRRIRTIFFEFFVEALVKTIRGEKLIWMLETTPTGQRLYAARPDQAQAKRKRPGGGRSGG